jgi:hypothetical protein
MLLIREKGVGQMTLTNKHLVVFLFILLSLFTASVAFCDEIWSQEQLIKNLQNGSVEEIGIVGEGIRGKYVESHDQLEGFLVLGDYSSFSPEIIGLIQKHGVRVIPGKREGGSAVINYGALFLQIASWLAIVIGAIMLIMINAKLKKILDILSCKRA